MAKSSQAHDAGSLVLGQVFATLAEALSPILLVRIAGKEQVGDLGELLLYYTTLALVLTAGLPGTLSFHLPTRSRDERAAITRSIDRILLAVGALAGGAIALVGLGAWLVDHDSALAPIGLLVLYPLGDIPARLLPNLLVVEDRARAAAWIGIVRAIAMLSCTTLPLALGGTITTVVVCLSLLGILYAVTTAAIIRKVFAGAVRVPSPVSRGEILRFAWPLGLNEIVGNIYARFDRILVAVFFTNVAFADYQAGSWQIPLIPIIAAAVGVTYTPLFTRLFREGRRAEILPIWRAQTVKTALIVVALSTIFLIAAEEVMELLFTRDYVGAADVFRCFTIITLGRITSYGSILMASGSPRLILRASVVGLVSNAILGLPLLFIFGPIGPAVGSIFAFILLCATYVRFIGQALGVPTRAVFPLAGFLRVLGLAALAAIPAVALKLLVDLPVAALLLLEAATFIVTYAGLGTALGLIDRSDWRFLGDWIAMRRRREERP